MVEMESGEGEDQLDAAEEELEEIKRLIENLLSGTEMSTPELRRYFQLSNSQVWKIMSDLETSKKIQRTDKKGSTGAVNVIFPTFNPVKG